MGNLPHLYRHVIFVWVCDCLCHRLLTHPATKKMLAIPVQIADVLVPKENLNIIDLLEYNIPLIDYTLNLQSLPSTNLLSNLPSSTANVDQALLLHTLAMPSKEEIEALQHLFLKPYQSFIYPNQKKHAPGNGIRLPFWVLDYWTICHKVSKEKQIWAQAIAWLKQGNQSSIINALGGIPWLFELPREFGDGKKTSSLARLFSEDWLSGGNMDLMLAIMRDKVHKVGMTVAVVLNCIGQKLISTYWYEQDMYLTSRTCKPLHDIGDQLKEMKISAVCFAIGVSVSSRGVNLPLDGDCNHWVAVILDIRSHTIWYGDPMKQDPPSELVNVMTWWLGLALPGMHFTIMALPCARQKDTILCGILTMNSLVHYFFPTAHALYDNEQPCLQARAEWGMKIIGFLQHLVMHLLDIPLQIYIDSQPDSRTLESQASTRRKHWQVSLLSTLSHQHLYQKQSLPPLQVVRQLFKQRSLRREKKRLRQLQKRRQPVIW